MWSTDVWSSHASSIFAGAVVRLQVAFIEAPLEALPKDTTEAVQRVLYRAWPGVKLGSAATPDGEESPALFLAWQELGPLMAYAPEDGEWQAVVAMRELPPGIALPQTPHNGPSCPGGCARIPHPLLQGQVPIQLPPLLEGGCHDVRGQCGAVGGGTGRGVR